MTLDQLIELLTKILQDKSSYGKVDSDRMINALSTYVDHIDVYRLINMIIRKDR